MFKEYSWKQFLGREIGVKRIQLLSVFSSISPEGACSLSFWPLFRKSWAYHPDLYSPEFYNLILLWNMLSNYLWYHIENIYPVISVFGNQIFTTLPCRAHTVKHLLSFCLSSCLQPTSRKSWQTSSPSYWTARQRSKASTTLPSCPFTPPWSCVNDSAASWLPSAGCPPRGDELWGTARPLPYQRPDPGQKSMDLS